MIIDITEEERIFLERMCSRAEILAMKGILQKSKEIDLDLIRALKNKFRALNDNEKIREMEEEYNSPPPIASYDCTINFKGIYGYYS